MPTAAEMIDNAIKFVDNVDPTRGEQAKRRTRYLEFLAEGVDEFHHEIEYKSSYRQTTVTPDTTGQFPLPDAYLTVGRQGGLYDSNGQPFDERDLQELIRLLQSPGGATQEHIYAVGYGEDEADTRYIFVPRGWSGIDLTFSFRKIPPIPTDGGDELAEIPETYHYGILKPYLRFRGFEDRGDARASIWEKRYQDGMNRARRTEKAKDTTKTLPGSGYGGMY